MKRIAVVSEHASPQAAPGGVDSGGQNIYVANIAQQLASRGWKVDVFTRRDDASLPAVVEWAPNVRVVHVAAGPAHPLPKEQLMPYMEEFGRAMRAWFLCSTVPYDLIHANFFMSAMAALPVAREFDIPMAVTFHALGKVRRQHQAEADRFPDSRFTIEEHIVREADCIIAECPQDKTDLMTLYGADPRVISMIPCGFSSDEMAPVDKAEARKVLGWDYRAFHVLQLGRMVPRKGIDTVIRAVSRLHARHGRFARLCVVGGDISNPQGADRAEYRRLKALAMQEGVGRHIDFVGQQDRTRLKYFYCAADVFVTTPWYEPFGITPVEAMACATPVIGSDTGGIRYSVVDGETGFLVPPKDPGRLAHRLLELANDDDLAWAMGQAGVQRANQLFTWHSVGEQLSAVFDRLTHCAHSSSQFSEAHHQDKVAAL